MPSPSITFNHGVASETVVSSASFALSTSAEAQPLINWQPSWQELDLNFGLAFDAKGVPTLLDPAAYASVPRNGVQLADVRVQGSVGADRVVVGAGAIVEAAAGSDELDNTDSRGGNVLAGGVGTDQFLLRAAGDTVIGGDLLANASGLGLPAVVGQVDGERDVFLIDSSNPSPEGTLGILDFELGRDELLLDGLVPAGSWSAIREQLQALEITVNAAPQLNRAEIELTLLSGVQVSSDLGSLASDPDGSPLQLVKLEGPAWVTTTGTTLKATAPVGLSKEQIAALTLRLAFSDGQALVPLAAQLTLKELPPGTTPVTGAFNFNNSTDRSVTFLLDVDSTNLNGKLFDPNLLPKTGDFKLTVTKGGFSSDHPEQSSSKDVIKLEFLDDGSKQEVVISEKVSNERGELETISDSARGILPAVVNNYIHTRGGDDEIIGSVGIDYIRAGAGDDIIDAGAGNDVVRSGTGFDRVTLGAGADKLLITRDQLAGKDSLLDFSAEDSLVLSDGISVLTGLGSDTLKVGLANGSFQELMLAGTSLPTWNAGMITSV